MGMFQCAVCDELYDHHEVNCYEHGRTGLMCEDCHTEREEDIVAFLSRDEATQVLQAIGNVLSWFAMNDPRADLRYQCRMALAGAKETLERATERSAEL